MSTLSTMFETAEEIIDSAAAEEKYFGKYPGLVLENAAPEDAAHRGELLVEVPGILEENPDGGGERPIQLSAKPCCLPGSFVLPEKGGTVWVEFAGGKLDEAVWTGVWYATDAAPQTAEGNAPSEFQKVIRTASGHVIELDDSDGEERVVIVHKSGATIELAGDSIINIVCDTLNVDADVNILGDLKVGTGPTTTISGNEITGAG